MMAWEKVVETFSGHTWSEVALSIAAGAKWVKLLKPLALWGLKMTWGLLYCEEGQSLRATVWCLGHYSHKDLWGQL